MTVNTRQLQHGGNCVQTFCRIKYTDQGSFISPVCIANMTTCADTGIFVRGVGGGGGVQVHPQKTSDTFFFFIFNPQLIYRGGPMVYFKDDYNFPRFQRGSNIFQGWGPTFARGDPIAYSL